jgi:hypothetical protein
LQAAEAKQEASAADLSNGLDAGGGGIVLVVVIVVVVVSVAHLSLQELKEEEVQ